MYLVILLHSEKHTVSKLFGPFFVTPDLQKQNKYSH